MRLVSILLLASASLNGLSSQSEINADSLLSAWRTSSDQGTFLDSLNSFLGSIQENHIKGADTLFQTKHHILVKLGMRVEELKNAVTFTIYLIKSFQPEKAKKFIKPYFTNLSQIENSLQKADVIYAYGHVHEDLRENERAFGLMNEAVDIYEEAADTSYENYTSALIALGRVAFTISDYPASSIALNKAKALSLRNRDSVNLRGVHQDLTILFSQIGLYDEAEEYWNERGKYFSKPETKESQSIGLVNLGRNLILQDRWEDALNNYETSQSYSPFTGGWSFMDVYNYNGIIECLYFLDRWDSIPKYFDLLQDAFDKINRSVTYEFLFHQSEFLTKVATGQFRSAEKIGLDLLADAEKSNDGAEIMMHARFLSELYQTSGNAVNALKYNKKYIYLKDSIQNAQKTNALLLYQTQFETTEKENEIYRLEKEGELLNAKIARNRLFRALMLAGLALIVLIAIIIYYRIKQKELIKMQDLRMGISSDLHDEVGSLLSGVTMQTQMLNVIPEEQKPDFIKEIGANTRRAVSTMRDLVWSIDSRRDKVEDLKDKIADTCQQLLEPAGFKYGIDLSGDLDHLKKLNPKTKKEIYLIAKEATNNIVKHSSGDVVHIKLVIMRNEIKLSIGDNGRSHSNPSLSGQGLENMQHRANSIDGSLKIDHSDRGFEIHVSAPC